MGFVFVSVGGWPAPGKSTLAAALGPRLGLPVLDGTWFDYARTR